jgi:hypothetical protein
LRLGTGGARTTARHRGIHYRCGGLVIMAAAAAGGGGLLVTLAVAVAVLAVTLRQPLAGVLAADE